VLEPPARDLVALLQRTGHLPPHRARHTPFPTAAAQTVGAQRTFWIRAPDAQTRRVLTATLAVQTEHLDMWVEAGQPVSPHLAQQAARFERAIHPVGATFFPPDIVATRLAVLHVSNLGAEAMAHYVSLDEYPPAVYPWSNGTSMIYVNTSALNPASDYYLHTLAHEWQHALHWQLDPNEALWFNEGLSELIAAHGTGIDNRMSDIYWQFPDVPLLSWSASDVPGAALYGGVHLFLQYALDRLGAESLHTISAHGANGVTAFQPVLFTQNMEFDDLFADWLVTNGVADKPARTALHLSYPAQQSGAVFPYGADYIEIRDADDRLLRFQGEPYVSLLPAPIPSGRYVWWSNQADNSHTTLTRRVDLQNVTAAHLTFRLWYDIAAGDCAYVAVSNDGGTTWQPIPGQWSTRPAETHGAGCMHGPHYVGRSGREAEPEWVDETLDLSPFAGRSVLLRVEYITDEAGHGGGLALDDLAIPAIGYADDVETPTGWQALGFVHLPNRIPQRYLLRAIVFRTSGPDIRTIQTDDAGRAVLPLTQLDAEGERVLFIVSVTTPFLETAVPYSYVIE